MLLVPVATVAEMSGDDYSPPPATADAAARAQAAVRLEAERRAAAAAAASAAERERAARLRAQAALRQRPLGAQLLDARCTACHSMALAQDVRRGVLGWRFTVERMRWWHGAALQPGEAAVVADHLAATHPAGVWREVGEWLVGAAMLLGGPSAWWAVVRLRRVQEPAS